jgi:hypothetical protein
MVFLICTVLFGTLVFTPIVIAGKLNDPTFFALGAGMILFVLAILASFAAQLYSVFVLSTGLLDLRSVPPHCVEEMAGTVESGPFALNRHLSPMV